jgi:mono/diheme cytochrome c family protein
MDRQRRRVPGAGLAIGVIGWLALAWLPACGRPAGEGAPAVAPASPPSGPVAAPEAPAPAAAAPVSSPDSAADKLLVTEDEYQGWKYYAVYCERCHAPDAVGTQDAPDLRYSVSEEGQVTADSFRVIVRNGTENVEENRVMKGFVDLLDDRRIAQVYAYVVARSEGRLAPGRPHRRAAP